MLWRCFGFSSAEVDEMRNEYMIEKGVWNEKKEFKNVTKEGM